MSKPNQQTLLRLPSGFSNNDAARSIKAHIGDPPFTGKKSIAAASKIAIVNWRRDHSDLTARGFANRLGVPFHTYKNWQQAAAGSQGGKAKAVTKTKDPTRHARSKMAVAATAAALKHEAAGNILKSLAPKPRAARKHRATHPQQGIISFASLAGATLHLPNGARITGLTMAQLTELAKELTATKR